MKLVPYVAEHMESIQLQGMQLRDRTWMGVDQAEVLESAMAFTILDGDEVVMIGGVLELWPGRGSAWSFMAEGIGHRFTQVHRMVKKYFDALDIKRLEAEVGFDFPQGHRWMKMLGFHIENPRMQHYFPDGTDAVMYVRIN